MNDDDAAQEARRIYDMSDEEQMIYGLREQQEILNLARRRIAEEPGLSARDFAELLQVMQWAAEAKAGMLGLLDPPTE
jgi:hypothetical protein